MDGTPLKREYANLILMTDEDLKKLVENYRPSEDVLKAVKNVRLIAIVGPSAAGKTSIVKMAPASSRNLHIVGDVTCRPKRPGEIEGIEFVFHSKDQMIEDIKAGKYVQVVCSPSGDLYATRVDDFPQHGVGIMAVYANAIGSFRRLFAEVLPAFIVPYSFGAWLSRFNTRQMTPFDRAKRLNEAVESFEFALSDPNTKFILNDDLDSAAGRIVQLTNKQKPDQEDRAKQIAKDVYQQIKDLVASEQGRT